MMWSYEFEQAAKNAVIDTMKKISTKNIKFCELELVWFAHSLGYKKCTIHGVGMGKYYAEVTYNAINDAMGVDIYEKVHHEVVYPDDFRFATEGSVSNEQ